MKGHALKLKHVAILQQTVFPRAPKCNYVTNRGICNFTPYTHIE